ncbi:MAG: B12-binding domain-containing radical SAM protein [Vulcanimicrobiota bacterium]
MKAGDIKKTKRELDLLLIHCDLFYGQCFPDVNLGLQYIATYLKKNGFRVSILGNRDFYIKTPLELEWVIVKKKPRIIGFYTISDNIELVVDTAGIIRELNPDAYIIAGGPLATGIGKDFLEEFKVFDALITGEGEYPCLNLCNYFVHKKGGLGQIPGLIFREENRIVSGPPAKLIENLDTLPFPDLKYTLDQTKFQIVSGRGCPYKCAFCFQAGHGLKFRFRSAENVLEEVIHNLNHTPAVGFDFCDDAFIVDLKRCEKIAEGLQEYRQKTGRDFIFFCQGRANVVDKNRKLIKKLIDAGMVKMQIGIETGAPEILKIYNKQLDISQVRNTVEIFTGLGRATLAGGFILGGPAESYETFEKSVELARELIQAGPGIFEVSSGFLGAYPGTEIAENPGKFSLKLIEPDFSKGHSLEDVQFETPFLNRNQLRQIKIQFQNECLRAMESVLGKIPERLVKLHFKWAEKYGLYTEWYSRFFQNMAPLQNYFNYLDMKPCRKMEDIDDRGLLDVYPTRTVLGRNYDAEGNIILPYSTHKVILTDPIEKKAYELSSGKLRTREIIQRLQREYKEDLDVGHLLTNFLKPFYKKLERSYHIIFNNYTHSLKREENK